MLRKTRAVSVFVVIAAGALASVAGSPAGPAASQPRDPAQEEEHALDFFHWVRRALPGDAYALDAVPRYLDPGQSMTCPSEELVTHRGDAVRYRSPVRVHGAFVDRLRRFEQTVHDVAVEVYGRAPRSIDHAGTYNCRLVRGRHRRISEHALGNAIDVRGFRFGPLPRSDRASAPAELPPALRRGFAITIERHWSGRGAHGAIHQRFLHTLGQRLDEERIFRGMIGPAHRRHRNHLHLDAGPYRFNWL